MASKNMYVIAKNIPKCKNFIQYFVKEVIVYKTHVEVIFNVSFNYFIKDIKTVIRKNRDSILNVYKRETLILSYNILD